jgi:hypothetical protein
VRTTTGKVGEGQVTDPQDSSYVRGAVVDGSSRFGMSERVIWDTIEAARGVRTKTVARGKVSEGPDSKTFLHVIDGSPRLGGSVRADGNAKDATWGVG